MLKDNGLLGSLQVAGHCLPYFWGGVLAKRERAPNSQEAIKIVIHLDRMEQAACDAAEVLLLCGVWQGMLSSRHTMEAHSTLGFDGPTWAGVGAPAETPPAA